MRYQVFQTFVDRLNENTDVSHLEHIMADISAALHLPCFAYLALPHRSNSATNLVSNYPPAWTAHYLQRGYERVDPVIAQALRSTQPFQWGLGASPKSQSESERELFEEAAKFGIRCGITIPIHDSTGGVAAVTFAADDLRSSFERSTNEDAQVLQLIAMYFHAHAKRMSCVDRVVNGIPLSPREFECLEWSSQGKSAWEIGSIIGISRRTAAFHLDNVRSKLGVRTIRQAVALLAASKRRR